MKGICAKIKKKYSSLRKASKLMKGISWKCVHKIFNPKELHVERQIKTIDEEDVHAFFKMPTISTQLPNSMYFMTHTLWEAYQEYMKLHKKHNKRIVGFSMFWKLRPRQVKFQRAMPSNQCGCDTCINFKLIRSSLQSNGCVNVPMRVTLAVCKFVPCQSRKWIWKVWPVEV